MKNATTTETEEGDDYEKSVCCFDAFVSYTYNSL